MSLQYFQHARWLPVLLIVLTGPAYLKAQDATNGTFSIERHDGYPGSGSSIPASTVSSLSTATTSSLVVSKCSCTKGTCRCGAKKTAIEKAVAGAYKPVFYNNNFSYFCDPSYNQLWPGDHFKQRRLGHCAVVDVGGQYRTRQMSEQNFRGLGLTGNDDDFLLQRLRLFTNVQFENGVRFYFEYLDAVSEFEEYPPRPIEENRSDIQNLFIDGPLVKLDSGLLRGRVGRQELLYGAQRIVSPLDWGNTRRTFDGGKLMWQGDNWHVDGFWTRPLRRHTRQLDNPNQDQQFYGIWGTRQGLQKDALDVYWFAYDNDDQGFRFDTIGARYFGSKNNWFVEIQGAHQFGRNTNDSSHSAGFATGGIGRKFNHCWNPQLWLYYDWASGTDKTGAGNGYHQFFPLAHGYLGFMDLYGRRNIETPNVKLSFQPHDKIKVLLWYYYFFLENKNDTPYSVAMTPFHPDVRPRDADLGHEIDCTMTYAINARMSLLFGYSHFFSGKYYDTPGLPYSGDADFYYTQYQFNF